jgi:hypothetical protein
MRYSEFFESYRDINTVNLTLRTDPDTPGALRLIDTNSRQLMGLVRSPADITRFMNPRQTHGGAFVIKIPPQVYQENKDLIDNIMKFKSTIEKTFGRKIDFNLQQS